MSQDRKSVLILGAGLVTPPLVQYLAATCGFKVTLANRSLESAEKMVKGLANASAKQLDVEKEADLKVLDELVPQHDAVVSMLPYLFHPVAARAAVKHKKHFFTTSYVTDFMRELDEEAKKAGIIMINECGVDPGTDHMSAMRVIDDVRARGGKIISFTSYCGGLPAPANNNNPFGYKLSWAPRGVLLASRNSAHFIKDGKDTTIPGKDLFDNYQTMEIEGLGTFECYPNRDSTNYIDIFGLKYAQTMIRGTFRYKGYCPTIKKLADLGYLSLDETNVVGKTYLELTQNAVNTTDENVRPKVAEFLKIDQSSFILDNLEWLGLFRKDKKVPEGIKTYLDALCVLCKEKLVYAPGEKDMILMKHEFIADFDDHKEWLSSTLIDYGTETASSMSRTVSFPVGIAIRFVLEGKIKLTGLHIPTIPELYNPILDELEKMNIKFIDKVDKVEQKK